MSQKDWLFALLEAVCWYFFVYILLYSIKNPVSLWKSSLLLIVLAYTAACLCPIIRYSYSWQNMFKK